MIREKTFTTSTYMRISLFTALIAVGAFIKVPVPMVPFTLQFFFTTLAGALLGAKAGALSVLIYTMLGLIGAPVFAQGGGLHYIFNPTFGYIVGFIFGSYFVGAAYDKGWANTKLKAIFYIFISLLIVYAFGISYYYVMGNYIINSPIGIKALFIYGFLLAVPGDIFLTILASFVADRINRTFRRSYEYK